jgi:hypothetical protein
MSSAYIEDSSDGFEKISFILGRTFLVANFPAPFLECIKLSGISSKILFLAEGI